MMLIECPHCGPRDEEEFTCGGQAGIERPAKPEQATDEEWAAYLFNRVNPQGLHREMWRHSYGCRQWFLIDRDTVTHDITPVPADGGEAEK